ncbi:MAG TPA: response regulator transcription factor [Dissulfurispiraceae bacterium]|nr:response regulator transcription factor [Dissulfurispiraceae bacterium]
MRIAIVEDNHILLENLKMLLMGESNMEVVGSYSSAESALNSLDFSSTDVMLVDIGLPGMSGIDLIGKVKASYPEMDIMAHTIFENRESVFSAIKAGASAYILKGSRPVELIDALNKLFDGGAPMSPKIARMVIQEFQDAGSSEQYLLSRREKEVLKEIEKGMSYKEIAGKLNISPQTIHTHIKKIYEKLHAQDRRDALVKARKKGII